VPVGVLAEIATGLWRLRHKMLRPGSDEPVEGMESAYRHLESLWDTLTEAGVRVHDHTGEPFDSGLPVRTLAFQPAEVQRETVIETIRPTVYLAEQRIQLGEVIVGTPEPPPQGEPPHDAHDH